MSIFSNREIATGIWLSVLLFWALLHKDVRTSFAGVFKIFFSLKVFIPFLTACGYVSAIVFLLYKIGPWDVALLKDTIYWFLITAVVLFFNADKANKEARFFSTVIAENLAFFVIFEFLLNLYSFSLLVELILVPLVTLVVMMIAVAEFNKEAGQVKTVLNTLLAIMGFYLLFYALYNIATDFKGFATTQNLRIFILPPLLTIAFLPFIYFIALWMRYEDIFLRLNMRLEENRSLRRFAKRKIFFFCHLNLRKLNKFSKQSAGKLWNVRDQKDVLEMIEQFINSRAHAAM